MGLLFQLDLRMNSWARLSLCRICPSVWTCFISFPRVLRLGIVLFWFNLIGFKGSYSDLSRGRTRSGCPCNTARRTHRTMTGSECSLPLTSGKHLIPVRCVVIDSLVFAFMNGELCFLLCSASECDQENPRVYPPLLCTAPIKVCVTLT